MLDQLTRYETDWRKHHRRFMDEPSIIKQILELAVMLSILVLLLMHFP